MNKYYQQYVESTARDIEEAVNTGNLYEYLEDALDIEYRCDSRKEYRSVQIALTIGGPSVYIDTANNRVELYWGGQSAFAGLSAEAVSAIDDWACEYWEVL